VAGWLPATVVGYASFRGIMYLAALKLGMTVHERHAHSRDIYREDRALYTFGC
jgi:hypothetical protein